ncbi:hypothetical protein [Shewanella maritima]|uniref:hypothetical protein n=1 Tax=Shewanella maritima TaxID=2520507 RepID=UPI003734DAB2
MHNKLSRLTVFGLILLCPTLTVAQEQQRQMRKPPQEAFDICVDKSESDQVTITTPKGEEVTATCQLMGDDLVAVPEGHSRPSRSKNNRG